MAESLQRYTAAAAPAAFTRPGPEREAMYAREPASKDAPQPAGKPGNGKKRLARPGPGRRSRLRPLRRIACRAGRYGAGGAGRLR